MWNTGILCRSGSMKTTARKVVKLNLLYFKGRKIM
jgi:hypothetical protein